MKKLTNNSAVQRVNRKLVLCWANVSQTNNIYLAIDHVTSNVDDAVHKGGHTRCAHRIVKAHLLIKEAGSFCSIEPFIFYCGWPHSCERWSCCACWWVRNVCSANRDDPPTISQLVWVVVLPSSVSMVTLSVVVSPWGSAVGSELSLANVVAELTLASVVVSEDGSVTKSSLSSFLGVWLVSAIPSFESPVSLPASVDWAHTSRHRVLSNKKHHQNKHSFRSIPCDGLRFKLAISHTLSQVSQWLVEGLTALVCCLGAHIGWTAREQAAHNPLTTAMEEITDATAERIDYLMTVPSHT